MTNRLQYGMCWAQDGEAVDPDLDTTAPSFIANRYASVGWRAEKPPEEWQNFLSQITDVKVLELIVSGLLSWDSGVVYKLGAITKVGDKLYKRIAASPSNVSPDKDNSGWSLTNATTSEDYVATLAALKKLLTGHTSAANPHEDTMAGLVGGGYEKEETDLFFLNPTDPRTIGYHMAIKDVLAHGETPEQLGTLPVSGGTFTEHIWFLAGVLLQGGGELEYNTNTARLELSLVGKKLSIDTNGDVWIYDGVVDSLVMTVANYPTMQIRAGYVFALPLPIFQINLETTIQDLNGIGWKSLDTTKDPVFEYKKGFKFSDNNTSIVVDGSPNLCTGWVRYSNAAGVVSCVYKDSTVLSSKTWTLSEFFSWFGIADATNILQMAFYPRLSLYQKSMLVR